MRNLYTVLFIVMLFLSGCSSDDDSSQQSECFSDQITEMVSFEFLQTVCENMICETFFKVSNLTDCDFQVSFSLYYDRFDSVNNIEADEPIHYGETIIANGTETNSILHREETQLSYTLTEVYFCEDIQGGCTW